MSIFEYDEEKHMALIRSEGYEDGVAYGKSLGVEEGIEQGIEKGIAQGIEQGIEKGITQGEDRLALLIQKLNDTDRQQEVSRVLQDREYRQKLYQEFEI